MANLRANTIAGSGGSGNNTKASLYLDGSNEYLSFADNADFAMGTGDLTAECWFYVESNVDYRSIIDARDAAGDTDGWMIGVKADGNVYVYAAGWLLITTGAEGTINTWHHVAYVRKDGTHTLYFDGVSKATSTTSKDYTTQKFAVGTTPYSLGNEDFKGYISSVNLVKGSALYTGNFDPDEVSPKVLSDTVLLCCNDSQKPEAYEVSPGVITPGGTPTPSKFIPSNLAVPTGTVFGGDPKFNTQGAMYFPTGDTSQRGRGRGLIACASSPSDSNVVEYVEIQSQGTAKDFGDLSIAISGSNGGCSSSTRGLFAGGWVNPANSNVIEYFTISTTSNSTDFGDMTVIRRGLSGCGNDTRGLFVGGRADPGANPTDVIDYVTIATIGNAIDFGNLSLARRYLAATSNTTRGLIAGGYDSSPGDQSDVIDYVTIATTGNATDFGNLTTARDQLEGNASSTRGVFGGGANSPTFYNIIDYVTIASTGNATDFGDLINAKADSQSASNSLRGIWAGGATPTKINTISFVEIATTGNATRFGDLTVTGTEGSGCSDSHGGIE